MINAKSSHLAVLRAFAMICGSVGSQYSTRALRALERDGYKALGSDAFRLEPSEYSNSYSFAQDYLVQKYLSKFEGSSDRKELERLAIASFEETEREVADTNRRLRYCTLSQGVEGILSDAKRKICDILGVYYDGDKPFPWEEFSQSCGWGKGATASLTAAEATLDKKILEAKLGVTRRCVPYAQAYLKYNNTWLGARYGAPVEMTDVSFAEFSLSEDGRFETVDKDWKSRRSIDIQPTLNLFFQKSVGKMIRRRLKRRGIDLDDQSRNQELASRAYHDGYATIDLAKASDTVSTELVRLLLPKEWFDVMWDLRTHRISINGESKYIHKFSAMGNGFTFELESMIFYALCWAVVRCEGEDAESDIAVYGDDIIVSQRHAERVITVLTECGFKVNVDKTYTKGPFYESCGKHYFQGVEVTPIYQKEAISDLSSCLSAANRLFRWSWRSGDRLCLDRKGFSAWSTYVALAHNYHSSFNFSQRKRKKKLLPFPYSPPTDVSDDGLLWHDDSVFVLDQNRRYSRSAVVFQPHKLKGNGYALFSEYLRKSGGSEFASYGFVTPRGSGSYRYSMRSGYLYEPMLLAWV